MNCLLMREISLRNTIRMWDTYMVRARAAGPGSWSLLPCHGLTRCGGHIVAWWQAEEDGYATFHMYVCAAFLITWTKELQKMDFQVTPQRRPPHGGGGAAGPDVLLAVLCPFLRS